jgi:glycosyltransferase involved in cell wall biosynthesis
VFKGIDLWREDSLMNLISEQLDFTVAIATYNGAKRVPLVLDHLSRQQEVANIRWEIIVVDNNSNDDTAEIIRRYQKSMPNLRYAFEPAQGAGYARHKAVRLARSPLIGFLDDDNLPSPLWVKSAYQFAQDHPRAGLIGSRIQGIFDSHLPENFDRIAAFLALIDRGDSPLIYAPEMKVLPPGAGTVVRRRVWLENVPAHPVLTGRTGKTMLTGEDLEAALHIQKAGWEIWYNPAMRLQHVIPQQRLTRQYLISLMRGIGLSRYRTRMLSVNSLIQPQMTLAYSLNDIRKIIWHLMKHGTAAWTDTVAVSELTLYLFSLISPLFFLQKAFKQTWLQCIDQNSINSVSMQDLYP